MYNSQYYTCEQIDQRLLQGYVDDYNQIHNTELTKAQFLTLLGNTMNGFSNLPDKLKSLFGYYVCITVGADAEKIVQATNYELTIGGNIRIKMAHANTASSVKLNINGTGAKALYYNGEAVSPENTWQDDETIVVYYDGEKYLATNSLGGGANSALVEELNEQINGSEEVTVIDPTQEEYVNGKYINHTSNTWSDNTNFVKGVIIPIEPGAPITMVGGDANIYYAILKTVDLSVRPYNQNINEGASPTLLSSGETVTIDPTDEGNYLCLRIGYSGTWKYPTSIVQTKTIDGLAEKIRQAGVFKTGESVKDISIDSEPNENSNGLVRSGGIFPHLYAQVEEEYITPSLTGTIGSSYINYYFSAGKTVYDHDVRVIRLIFNENIRDYTISDTTFNFYIASPNSVKSELGTAIEGTIAAGTNYADVDVIVPASKIIYVQNKSVSGSSELFKPDCLIASTANSEESYYCNQFATGKGTMLAGFSYVYSVPVGIKEYVDLKNEKILGKIEDGIGNKGKVSWTDAQTVVIFGSSLTDQYYAPAGHLWEEEINNIVDINIVNYGCSGHSLLGNMSADYKQVHFSPEWIMWNNQANSTPYNVGGYKQLLTAKELTEAKGAKMILGGENATADGAYILKWVDKLFDAFAEEYYIPRSELRRELVSDITQYTYILDSGRLLHLGWRTQSPFITKHMELLGRMPIAKSVKIYKLRPGSTSLTIAQLAYDTPVQRMKHFYAASTGVVRETTPLNPCTFQNADNIAQTGGGFLSEYFPTPMSERTVTRKRETERMKLGEYINIPNNKAVVEFIVDRRDVHSCKFSCKCSVVPTIYVAVDNKDSNVYDGSPRTYWQEVSNVTQEPGYPGTLVSADVEGDISLYDKIRFLLVSDIAFDLRQPELEYYDGAAKPAPVLDYKPRRYGVECNPNLYIDNSWTMTGGASVEQIPSDIGYYKTDTSHIELASADDSAYKTVAIPAGTKRVAIRVMASRFIPLQTTRFNGTSVANSRYVSTAQVINNYDCDLGVMDIVINDAAVSRQVICPGFAWSYVEYNPDLADTSLRIEVKKPDDDTAPTMIYALSVQVIEQANTEQ